MDFLQSLREALKRPTLPKFSTSNGTQTSNLDSCAFITLVNQIVVHRSAKTPFKAQRGTGQNYPLDSLIYVMIHRALTHTEYMQKCKKSGIQVVSMVDRKDLVSYLSAERSSCDQLDAEFVPPPIYASIEEAVKRSGLAEVIESSNDQEFFRMEKTVPQNFGTSKKSYSFILTMLKSISAKEKTQSSSSAGTSKQPQQPVKAALKAGSTSLLQQMKERATQSAAPSAETASPIIIVPSSYSSLLNMFNVADFLAGAETFQTPSEARQKHGGRKESKCTIQHHGHTFIVIDNVNRLKLEDWNSVVAVFAQGEAYQFKGWKWASPVDLFSKVKGFHLKYEDEAVQGEVKKWNVEILNISKSKRHLDSAAVVQFWNSLSAFMAKRGL
jgi:hypothetical protein